MPGPGAPASHALRSLVSARRAARAFRCPVLCLLRLVSSVIRRATDRSDHKEDRRGDDQEQDDDKARPAQLGRTAHLVSIDQSPAIAGVAPQGVDHAETLRPARPWCPEFFSTHGLISASAAAPPRIEHPFDTRPTHRQKSPRYEAAKHRRQLRSEMQPRMEQLRSAPESHP